MHDLDLAMGAHSLRAGRRRILTVTVVAEVSHPTRELIVVLNEAIHRGLQFSAGGSDGGIGFH